MENNGRGLQCFGECKIMVWRWAFRCWMNMIQCTFISSRPENVIKTVRPKSTDVATSCASAGIARSSRFRQFRMPPGKIIGKGVKTPPLSWQHPRLTSPWQQIPSTWWFPKTGVYTPHFKGILSIINQPFWGTPIYGNQPHDIPTTLQDSSGLGIVMSLRAKTPRHRSGHCYPNHSGFQ